MLLNHFFVRQLPNASAVSERRQRLNVASPHRARQCTAAPQLHHSTSVPQQGTVDVHHVDVVLSSGFLAFAAHCGFLQAIEDAGLRVRGVCGTSSGALVGSLYAAGYSPKEIAYQLSRVAPISRVRPSGHPWRGLLSLKPVIQELTTLLPPRFEDLKLDFGVGVVGRGSHAKLRGHELVDSGPLAEAVAASAAVPVLFSPIAIPEASNNPYIDGGIACRIGLDLWRQHRRGQSGQYAVHLIARSSPFSGNDSVQDLGDGVMLVCSPKSGASLWDLQGFEEQFEAARQRALAVVLDATKEAASV